MPYWVHSDPHADDGHWRDSARPCQYPGCADLDGNPRLTPDTFCEPSRRHYRRVLDWLLEDYAALHGELGQPTARGESVQMSREYGHPGEALSDAKRHIARTLADTADAIADQAGHTPPPEPNGHRESSLAAISHRYLAAHFDTLCSFPGAPDAAAELHSLHGQMRRMLGHNRQHQTLPAPCPECDMLTLTRTVDPDGTETIECAACAHLTPEHLYPAYLRVLVAEFAPQGCDVSQWSDTPGVSDVSI